MRVAHALPRLSADRLAISSAFKAACAASSWWTILWYSAISSFGSRWKLSSDEANAQALMFGVCIQPFEIVCKFE